MSERSPGRVEPGPGQESVWDYPRPPRAEPTAKRLRIVVGGRVLADTVRGWRVLETSHPPVYYFPPTDVDTALLRPSGRRSFCEFKGAARYVSVTAGDRLLTDVGWFYPEPTAPFAPLAGFTAFYASPMNECTVDGERVVPQPGGFYGGWVTADVVGPFKGGPGSWGW